MTFSLHSLTFSSTNSRDVNFPHNDALVVTLWMNEFEINRVLVDPGYGIKIMFISTIQHIMIPVKGLIPIKMPIVRFDGL